MCDAEKKARNMIKGMKDTELMTQWIITTYLSLGDTPELASVRGWLMDEIEERFPKGFNAWLEQEAPKDEDLKDYVLGEMRERRRHEHKLAR